MEKTTVTSFIIRFKQEQEYSQAAPAWRGQIRHIQTSRETHFTRIEEALSFMAEFVEIDEQAQTSGDLKQQPS